MGTANRTCTSCQTPIPADAAFCPTCGEATPTEITKATGGANIPQVDADETAYRDQLPRVLGAQYKLRDLIGHGGLERSTPRGT